jgi:hypothetical protein
MRLRPKRVHCFVIQLLQVLFGLYRPYRLGSCCAQTLKVPLNIRYYCHCRHLSQLSPSQLNGTSPPIAREYHRVRYHNNFGAHLFQHTLRHNHPYKPRAKPCAFPYKFCAQVITPFVDFNRPLPESLLNRYLGVIVLRMNPTTLATFSLGALKGTDAENSPQKPPFSAAFSLDKSCQQLVWARMASESLRSEESRPVAPHNLARLSLQRFPHTSYT